MKSLRRITGMWGNAGLRTPFILYTKDDLTYVGEAGSPLVHVTDAELSPGFIPWLVNWRSTLVLEHDIFWDEDLKRFIDNKQYKELPTSDNYEQMVD